ncbi:PSP1 C-terminal conserved region-domain-containing protein [Cunninghamella echinulata]|nr:PSP1 C-terminal conserved region-domain-containing protein [Cunninghamella echinulata]
MGKGIPLHHFLDSNTKLYIIEFKACRTDICYIMQGDQINPVLGDLVIVEADRGRDLGKVANILTANEICQVKRLFRLADALEITTLYTKKSDEEKALLVCQTKVQQRELPMQVVSAEYQWDRRKLTFYFLADQRIDFRELVRELFKIYKTRIWMCALKSNTNELLPE